MLIAFRTFAVSVGKVISWSTPKGKVFFEGSTHDRKKGLQCRDCHSNVFTMKKGMNKMTMQDINDGKFCGACHNGSRAFKASDPANCSRCHA
ncbi:MAG: c(7)-type cytochrome triheme domain-containing protein [Nitrospirota bacterium]